LPPLVLPSGRTVPIHLRRHRRSKRFVLRVSGGVIQLTIPTWGSRNEAQAWLHEQKGFVQRELDREGEAVPFAMGTVLPVLGQECRIAPGLKTSGEITDGVLAIAPAAPAKLAARVNDCLRKAVGQAAAADLDEFWDRLGVAPAPVSVRSYRRRWGACSADGETMINWRLVFAPREVLRAVCAHEAAHRIEMNHSAAFYAVLDRLLPERDAAEAWLKSRGATLSAYGRPTNAD